MYCMFFSSHARELINSKSLQFKSVLVSQPPRCCWPRVEGGEYYVGSRLRLHDEFLDLLEHRSSSHLVGDTAEEFYFSRRLPHRRMA